jgi:uncharacterized Zn-binding protein involved in type VI secretion
LSQAQDTAVVLPERIQLRRALPVAAAPFVQQSPNGLYRLSIIDTGIELRGPKVDAGNMDVRMGQGISLRASQAVDIRGDGSVQMRGGGTVQITGDGSVQIMTGSNSVRLDGTSSSFTGARVNLGCPGGKPVARLGDQINPSVSPPVILQGSPTVLVC